MKGETWVTDAGIEMTSVYWAQKEPNGNGNDRCAAVKPSKLINDIACDDDEFHGLCIQ